MTQPRIPAPIEIGPVRATVMADRGQTPEGRWYWRARRKVVRDAIWSGWATREEASAVLADRVARGLPLPSRAGSRARGPVRTLADLVEVWHAHQARRVEAGELAPRSLIAYRNGAAWWVGEIGDLLVTKLRPSTIQDVLLRWLASGVPPRSAKHARVVIGGVLAFGAERGLCPAVDLRRVQVRVEDDEGYANCAHTPTAAEVAAVLAAMPRDPLGDAIRLLAWTGARVGEIEALRVGDADLHARTLRLQGRDPERARRGKTGARVFPLDGALLDLLRELVDGRPADERILDLRAQLSDQVADRLEEVLAGLSLPRWTAHGLRRFAAMALLDSGMNAKQVSKLTGHSVLTLMRHYVRPTEDGLRRGVARAGLARITTGKRGTVLDLPRAQVPGTDPRRGRR